MSRSVVETPDTTDATVPSMSAPEPHSGLDVRTIAESALLMDITVLLSLLRVLVPIPGFQGLIRLACPIPFIVLVLRRGPRAGLIATVASCVLLSAFVGPLLAVQQLVVFGGLGTFFAWASRRRIGPAVVVVVGATIYGLLYLLPPFLFSLAVLHIDLGKTLHDVQRQAHSFLDGLSNLQVLGAPIGHGFVSTLSGFGPGRALLDGLHGIALTGLTHPLATLVLFFAGYSLLNVWAYLVVSIELYRRLPPEVRQDAQGERVDFFWVR